MSLFYFDRIWNFQQLDLQQQLKHFLFRIYKTKKKKHTQTKSQFKAPHPQILQTIKETTKKYSVQTGGVGCLLDPICRCLTTVRMRRSERRGEMSHDKSKVCIGVWMRLMMTTYVRAPCPSFRPQRSRSLSSRYSTCRLPVLSRLPQLRISEHILKTRNRRRKSRWRGRGGLR